MLHGLVVWWVDVLARWCGAALQTARCPHGLGLGVFVLGGLLVWSGVGTLIILGILRVVIGLRPASDAEREGLDLTDHGERAYNY